MHAYRKTQLKPVARMRWQLIRSISILMIVLVLSNLLMLDYSARLSYTDQIKTTQQRLSEQVGITFETFVRHVTDIVNKSAIFDLPVFDIEDAQQNPYDFYRSIASTLDSILATNSTLVSACIYFPELDQVYSTRMIRSRITSLENFIDKEIFENRADNHLVLLEPRDIACLTDTSGERVVTLIVPTTLKNSRQSSYLAVNINAERLYSTVKSNLDMRDDILLFVYGARSKVIWSNSEGIVPESPIDETALKQKNIAHASVPLYGYDKSWTSIYTSSYLGWTFVIESFLHPVNGWIKWFVLLNLLGLALMLLVIIAFIIRKTEPARELAQTLCNSQWKDMLADRVPLDAIADISDDMLFTDGGVFGLITISCRPRARADEFHPPQAQDYEKLAAQYLTDCAVGYRLIWMNKELLSAVIVMDGAGTQGEKQLQVLAGALFRRFRANGLGHVLLSVSLPQLSSEMLPLCYRQCTDTLQYRICLNTSVLFYSDLVGRTANYSFPEETVNHIRNNIAIGSEKDACMLFCQLLSPIEEKHILVDNICLISLLAQLQKTLIASVQGPLSLPESMMIEYREDATLQSLKESMLALIAQLCREATLLQQSREQLLRLAAVQYVDEHFCCPEITLAHTADSLKISKTLCSRLLREAIGETFAEYLNHRRIAHAKMLLEDKNKTIEEIALEVGYSYSYYFIKVFKQSEGITPGQYRSSLK